MDNFLNKFKALRGWTNKDFMQQLSSIAKSAGEATLEVYNQEFEVEAKPDSSPLTEADLASHKLIFEKLTELTPELPILSEESATIAWSKRREWQTYWLIDPLDGTKEFLKRNGEFTVNIALIHQNQPILGVVYAPVLDLLYFASIEIGAYKQDADNEVVPIKVAGGVGNRPMKVMGSRSHQTEEFTDYLKQFDSIELVSMGSSLKLCYVAEGKADIYPRLGPTSEWDTAAAHAIVKFAGGDCLNFETNKELTYNTKDSLLNPYFIVTGYKGRQGDN